MLFDEQYPIAVLPEGSDVLYYGNVFEKDIADRYTQALLENIQWQPDQAKIFGRTIITKRKVAWYASEKFMYTYSNITKQALLFTPLLLELKQVVEEHTHTTYNSCLLNLYHDGSEGMAWHSDSERELVAQHGIGSLSFGAERKFAFKNKTTKKVVSITLEHGSLLLMQGNCQQNWLHRLPVATKIFTPRINLTFRKMKVE